MKCVCSIQKYPHIYHDLNWGRAGVRRHRPLTICYDQLHSPLDVEHNSRAMTLAVNPFPSPLGLRLLAVLTHALQGYLTQFLSISFCKGEECIKVQPIQAQGSLQTMNLISKHLGRGLRHELQPRDGMRNRHATRRVLGAYLGN